MKKITLIFVLILLIVKTGIAQEAAIPDFSWGDAGYFNINIGKSLFYKGTEIRLLKMENQCNLLKIGNDTAWLKVSRRTLPKFMDGIRIFVADNKNVKNLTSDKNVHGLLTGDAILCISDYITSLLDPNKYKFPVSFNDGFLWNSEENSYMFSYEGTNKKDGSNNIRSGEGIFFDMQGVRGLDKHWIVAAENCRVEWIEVPENNEACILLRSESQPDIFYVYDKLYRKNISVRKEQKIIQGERIGTAWGNENWEFFQFSVIRSDTVPDYVHRYSNAVNIFPQIYDLYYKQATFFAKSFNKGRIFFGQPENLNDNVKNLLAFEEYSGKGWKLARWNTIDKVLSVTKGEEGNARISKRMFYGGENTFLCPENYFVYEINVPNGHYRIRAKIGDLFLSSWQKIEFEGINVGTFILSEGEQKWTNERIVTVKDRKLTVKIYVDETNNSVAGLSEIVFQQAD